MKIKGFRTIGIMLFLFIVAIFLSTYTIMNVFQGLNTQRPDAKSQKITISSQKNELPEKQEEPATTSPEPSIDYKAAGVDELNSVPILMYHRIYNMTNAETEYTGGNVDPDGYNRTCEAFEADLKNYYSMGYRMIRLTDYVDGKIDTAFGYSPLILTFDDGIRDVVLEGFTEGGTPVFDPTCAIGILEKMKKKYPDFNVTAHKSTCKKLSRLTSSENRSSSLHHTLSNHRMNK